MEWRRAVQWECIDKYFAQGRKTCPTSGEWRFRRLLAEVPVTGLVGESGEEVGCQASFNKLDAYG